MAQTVYVSTAAQLKAAVTSANTDTTFVMKGGDYGKINLIASQQGHLAKHHLTFVSEDANNPAVITGLDATGLQSGLTFDGITFDYSAARGAHQSYKWLRIENSQNVTVKNSTIDGDEANGLSKVDDGYPTGTGIFFRYNDGITFENNEVFQFFRGTTFQNSDNITVKNNEFYDMSSDALNFAAVTQVMIEGNYLHDYRSHPNTYAHRDMIQFWTQNETTPTTDVIIRGNIMDAGSGQYTQSIWINNEAITKQGAGNSMLYKNFVIEDNVIKNAHKHGIAVNNIDGLQISNNTILRSDGIAPDTTPQYTPVININGGVKNATINDNVIHGVNGSSWSGSGNLYVQRKWTTEANHYNDLFVNGMADDLGSWDDLMALPGGAIEKLGLGSSLLRYDTTPAQNTALMLSDDGEQLARHHHTFDVSNVFGPSGKVSTKGAQVVWDFGDGKSGTGLSPTHVYTTPGSYEVTATIKLANGKTVTADKVIEVETPVLIQADFENGGKDISGFENTFKTQNVSYVNDGGSKVAKFTKTSYIRYDRTEELFNNEGITILADFRKDQATDVGRLINFSDSIIVKIQGNGLQVTVTTDQTNKMFNINGAGINDTAWHRLAVTWDEKNDKAIVYVDGKQVGSPIDIKGSQISGNVAQNFSIGSNFKDAFSGLVDNVAFLGGAMDAGEVSSLHSGHKTLDTILNTPTGATGTTLPGGGGKGNLVTTVDPNTSVDTSNNTATTSGDTGASTNTDTGTNSGVTAPVAPGAASSSVGSVDAGSYSGGAWRYDMNSTGDGALVKANVTQKDLDVLLKWGKIKIDPDNDGKYEHVIDLASGVFDNGTFVATKATGGTLITFQPDTGSGTTNSGTTTSTPTTTTPPPSTPTSGTPQAPASSTGTIDTGNYAAGAWRYTMDDVNDGAQIWAKIDQSDLDLVLDWGKVKIDPDNDGTYEHVINVTPGVFDNGTFVTTKAGNGSTLVTFQPDTGTGSSTSGSSQTGSGSGSSNTSAAASGGSVDKGTYKGGAWRYDMNDADDGALINANVATKDLDVLLKWGKVKIDSDHDGDYDHIIDIASGVFDNGTFSATKVSGGTLVTFQADAGSGSGNTSGTSTSNTTTSSKPAVVNTTKSTTDTGDRVNGVWRYDMDTNDTAKVRAKITDKDLDVQLQWNRVKIDSDGDGKYEHIIHLEGNGFDNGVFKTASGGGGTTKITFEPAGGSAPASATGTVIKDGFKKGGVEYYTLSNKADQIFIDEKVDTGDLDVQLKWGKVKIDADGDGDVDYAISLEGNYAKGSFTTTSSNGGTLIGFQADGFDFG